MPSHTRERGCLSESFSEGRLPCLGARERKRIIESIKGKDGNESVPKTLLPALELQGQQDLPLNDSTPSIHRPEEIERPRSALHSGDFRETSPTRAAEYISQPIVDTEERTPFASWYSQQLQSFQENQRGRSRAPSVGSWTSSFAYRPPTSPLVHQSSNDDSDVPDTDPSGFRNDFERNQRRRTLPPETFRMLSSSPLAQQQNPNFAGSSLKRENTMPYQAHQPRRSISSMHSFHTPSNPQTPSLLRSRRQSISSDASPLQHASMVGSYEESILRGRMSTTPSKPLNFVAQIGVLGRGDCRPKLRCPPHVTVPFPAVFYSYPKTSGRRSIADDSPSPYVGTIDLEHNLKPAPRLRRNRRSPGPLTPDIEREGRDLTAPENTSIGLDIERKKRERQLRRSRSPVMPFGGCYRIPKEGQLQIVIKNPNKTAVKLFLIPYSLEGMESGMKTFIRQRSYSASPIIEPLLGSSPSTNSILTNPRTTHEKPVLRYLVHLMICCPAKGRFYLYDNIKVVFANRVPDGKESLKNEIQYPDPRYAPFKPSKEQNLNQTNTKLAIDMARRRSLGFGVSPLNFMSGADTSTEQGVISHTQDEDFDPPSLPSIPAQPTAFSNLTSQSFCPTKTHAQNLPSSHPTPPLQQIGFQPFLGSPGSPHQTDSSGDGRPLSGRNTPENGFRSGESSSLLARRLKGLDVWNDTVSSSNSQDRE